MRKPLATAVPAALMAVMLVVGSALAGHGHATGGGTFLGPFGLERLDFEAHDYGPASPRDRGTAHYRNITAGIEYTAKIVCAFVTEDVVRFGYIIPENNSAPALAGIEIVWQVTDGGSPGSGNDSAWYVFQGPGSNFAETCETTPAGGPPDNVLNGNFTVHEASD